MKWIVHCLVASGTFCLATSLYLCAKICYDENPICAINRVGEMMEFRSPCYMIMQNVCYGTTFEKRNDGECPKSHFNPTENYENCKPNGQIQEEPEVSKKTYKILQH